MDRVVVGVVVGVVLEGLLELAAGSVDGLVEELDVVDDLSEEPSMADVAGAARFGGRLREVLRSLIPGMTIGAALAVETVDDEFVNRNEEDPAGMLVGVVVVRGTERPAIFVEDVVNRVVKDVANRAVEVLEMDDPGKTCTTAYP